MQTGRYVSVTDEKQTISDKREHAPSKTSIYIPSDPDSSAGPAPTTSDIVSCSGSLSCSDLKNGGIYIKMVLSSYGY